LAFNSHFRDSILTHEYEKPAQKRKSPHLSLGNIKNTNHMKTNTASSNEEVILGWASMPTYGEVMNTLVGTDHTSVTSTLKLEKASLLKSFWSTLSNLK